MWRLHRGDALLLVIDCQEKLMPVIHDGEAITRNIERLIRGCRILDVPLLLTEQYVKGLGCTIAPIRDAANETTPIEKMCFSAFANGEVLAEMRSLKKKQILVAGIETHVCVHQTVGDLLANGYEVTLIADAVSSRTAANRDIAIRRMTSEGAKLSSTEMALFELLFESGTDEFRAISKLVK